MKCPGQDSRYWKPGAIFEVECPECNAAVEFFKDDTTRTCRKCGHRFVNPKMDFGCAAYCQFADQCIGTLPDEIVAQKEDLLKDRVAIEMKRIFKTDFKQIGHSTRVARYAEEIGKGEKGNLAIILCAAYLHAIGVSKAKSNNDRTDSEYLAQTSPVIARSIFLKLGANDQLIEAVCDLITKLHRSPTEDNPNLRIVADALQIATLEKRQKEDSVDLERLEEAIADSLQTASGHRLARKTLLKETVATN